MTPPPYRKALQPPHPSEPRVGEAFGPPPCQPGVPVVPVRYGISDSPLQASVFPMLNTRGYPALRGEKAYGLRTLRPGCYVYLCYFKDGRLWTQHYQVTVEARFAQIWWGEKDYASDAPGSMAQPSESSAEPWLLAPEQKTADTIYLFVSDTVLTHRTLYRIETNDGGLRDRWATTLKPAGGVGQAHAFNAVLLGNATPELLVPPIYGVAPFPWSEIPWVQQHADVNRIVNGMRVALMPRKDVVPLGVALQDPVGIASELNYLCHRQVKERDAYAARNKQRLQSAALIDSYFTHADASSDAKTAEGSDALAKQKALVDLSGARAFKPSYEKQLKTYDVPIKNAGLDVVAWMRLMDDAALLGTALSAFDLSCPRNAFDYEIAVLNCIGAAVHTDEGLKELTRQIDASPKLSPLWRALGAGDPVLMDRLNNPLAIAKAVFSAVDKFLEERPANAATNTLAAMVQHYVATAPEAKAKLQIERLRHISERRFSITIGWRDVAPQEYLRLSMELQGYVALGPDAYARWHLQATHVTDPTAGTTRVSATERIEIWDWMTIGEADVGVAKPLPMEGNPLMRSYQRLKASAVETYKPISKPLGGVFSGIGMVLAVWGMRGAIKEWNRGKNVVNFVAGLGASLALVGASLDVGGLAVATIRSLQGNSVAANIALEWGFKWSVTRVGAVAAAVMALADGIRAINASNDANPEQAAYYLGSALSGVVVAVASALAGTTLSLGPITITPVGWFVIIAVGVGATVWFSLKASEAQHSPMEIWLKHSAWGVQAKHYTLSQELEAWHSLHYRPRLSAKWTPDQGGFGSLRLRVTLPSSDGDDDLRTELRVTRNGKVLAPVNAETLASQNGYFNSDAQYCIQRISPSDYSVERGWYITMHEDAKVALSYLYRPHVQAAPDIGLEQQGAPAALEFTSGGWFSDPIDPDKIAVVDEPS